MHALQYGTDVSACEFPILRKHTLNNNLVIEWFVNFDKKSFHLIECDFKEQIVVV